MSSSTFQCPSCQAQFTGSQYLSNRRVRCPECDELVEAVELAKGTVAMVPPAQGDKTVLLEAVEVEEAIDPPEVLEVTEAIDVPVADTGGPSEGDGASGESRASAVAEEEEPPPFQPKREREETEMDMTPMVDVTFLLLIFFMVTATFTLQRSLAIPKPSDQDPSTNVIEEEPEDQSDFVTVQVDEFNTYHVVTVDWEEEAPSVQDLHIQLRKARSGDSTGTVPTKLRVEANGESLHEKVVAALDAGTATGFEEVQLSTVEDN